METKEIQIEGAISIPKSMTEDQFTTRFMQWLEAEGFQFGGGTKALYVEEEDSEEDKLMQAAEKMVPGYENYTVDMELQVIKVGNDYHEKPILIPFSFVKTEEA